MISYVGHKIHKFEGCDRLTFLKTTHKLFTGVFTDITKVKINDMEPEH